MGLGRPRGSPTNQLVGKALCFHGLLCLSALILGKWLACVLRTCEFGFCLNVALIPPGEGAAVSGGSSDELASRLPGAAQEGKSIAVFLQVGNAEAWPDLRACLSNVLEGADAARRDVDVHLGMFSQTQSDKAEAARLVESDAANLLQKWNGVAGRSIRARFRVNTSLENKGADIGLFLQQGLQVTYSRYELLLKLHSKTHKGWRCHMLASLCGSADQVGRIIKLFHERSDLGFLGPWSLTCSWNSNIEIWPCKFAFEPRVEILMKNTWARMFEKTMVFPSRDQYLMAAGSMFWARSAPLLEDVQLRSAAQRLLPSWSLGYQSRCNTIACLDAYALERILPTTIKALHGLVGAEAPDNHYDVSNDKNYSMRAPCPR
ncbi:unnamed protein product [Prorocentrum cordatum]|uniref:Protein xylosyltransferase n=1 Tax=Prorocentrum cordatum TaxID=2364126 RepID=A0ABN9UZD8_9DINO|nr:unnamed protein product [Polarella glacialis]